MLTALKWLSLAIWLVMIGCIIFRPGNKPRGRFLWHAGRRQHRRFVGQRQK